MRRSLIPQRVGRRTAALVVLAALAFTPLLTATPTARAAVSTADRTDSRTAPKAQLQTYGIGPANADGLDRRGAFVFSGRPGTVVKDQFALVNYTTKPRKVEVYAADAFTTSAGIFDVLAGDATSTDLGSWVDVDRREVTIPARTSPTSVRPGTLIVPFTLTVPANASPGDHAGGFVVSIRTDKPKTAAGTSAVVVDRRVGTRVYLQVEGPLDPRLELTNLTASYDGTRNPAGTGTTRVTYVVENTGNVVLSARQSTRVDTWFSDARPSTAQPDLLQLLPGAKVDVTVEVPGTWPTLRPTAEVRLVPYTGLPTAPTELEPVAASTTFWAIPWTLLAIVIALLLALLAWLYLRSRRPSAELPGLELPELVDAP